MLSRSMSLLLRSMLERVACTQQFSRVQTSIRITTDAPLSDCSVERGACYTCYTCCFRNRELCHGAEV